MHSLRFEEHCHFLAPFLRFSAIFFACLDGRTCIRKIPFKPVAQGYIGAPRAFEQCHIWRSNRTCSHLPEPRAGPSCQRASVRSSTTRLAYTRTYARNCDTAHPLICIQRHFVCCFRHVHGAFADICFDFCVMGDSGQLDA